METNNFIILLVAAVVTLTIYHIATYFNEKASIKKEKNKRFENMKSFS